MKACMFCGKQTRGGAPAGARQSGPGKPAGRGFPVGVFWYYYKKAYRDRDCGLPCFHLRASALSEDRRSDSTDYTSVHMYNETEGADHPPQGAYSLMA